MAEVDSLEISISSSASNATASIDKLLGKLSRLKGASDKTASSTGNLGDKVKDMGMATQSAGEKAGEAGNKVKSFGDKLKALGDRRFSTVGKMLKELVSYVSAFGKALSSAGKAIGGKMFSGITGVAKTFGNLFRQIARVAMYRAIRSAIRMITDGFKEGATNLYNWSQTADGVFASSMDRLSSSAKYLSNSLGAMAAPLINTVAPIIEYVIDQVVTLINAINHLFAVLAGQSTYTIAKKTSSAWNAAGKSASGAGKELKKTILAFDEINKLNDNSGGGGGGGGSSGSGGALGFENVPVASWLQDAVESGNFEFIGQVVGEKINKALDSINWAKIKSKTRKFVTNFTNFINGLIKSISPTSIGNAIGELINTAADAVSSFWNQIRWFELGVKIRDAIATALDRIDPATLAAALWGHINGALNTLLGLLSGTKLKWTSIVNKLVGIVSNVIDGFPAESIASAISGLFNRGLLLVKGLANNFTLTSIARKIRTVIEDAVKEIDAKELAATIGALLKDMLGAISVLLDIKLQIPDTGFDIPLPILLFGAAALRSALLPLIQQAFGSAVTWKGAAIAAGITLMVTAAINFGEAIADKGNLNSTQFRDQLFDSLGRLLEGAGLIVMSKDPALGVITLSVGLAIEFRWEAIDWMSEQLDWLGLGPTDSNVEKQLEGSGLKPIKPSQAGGLVGNTGSKPVTIVTEYPDGSTVGEKTGSYSEPNYKIDIITNLVPPAIPEFISSITSTATEESEKNPVKLAVKELQETVTTTKTNIQNAFKNLQAKLGVTPPPVSESKSQASTVATAWQTALNERKITAKVTTTAPTTSEVSTQANKIQEMYKKALLLRPIYGTINFATKLLDPKEVFGTSTPSVSISASLTKSWGSKTPQQVLGLNNLAATVSVGLSVNASKKSVQVTSSGSNRYTLSLARALGGIFSGGVWKNIPQYASGTANAHGSLFVAGEAGPEVVGHIGGRTEVLNKSQLAAAMYAAVNAAMAPASANFAAAAYSMGGTDERDTKELEEMLRVLREQTDYLREISDKEFATEVTTSAINAAQRRANRRAGVTVAPVGA